MTIKEPVTHTERQRGREDSYSDLLLKQTTPLALTPLTVIKLISLSHIYSTRKN
jgi:hypothetical protein